MPHAGPFLGLGCIGTLPGLCCSALTLGYVAIETEWADATGNGLQPRKEAFLQSKPEALGQTG